MEELLVRMRLGFTVCGAPLSIVGLRFGAEEWSRGTEVMSGGARLSMRLILRVDEEERSRQDFWTRGVESKMILKPKYTRL
jgi:hypothetical protein